MPLRTLYLRSAPNGGRGDGRSGGKLQQELCAHSSRSLVGLRVLPAGKTVEGQQDKDPGLISPERMRDLAPNVICMEGGLFADSRGTWKIPWPALESSVERGSVLIVADGGADEVRRHRSSYNHASRFLRARPNTPTDGGDGDTGGDCQIVCDNRNPVVSEWLRPALTGVSEITVRRPARIENWEQIAAATARHLEAGGLAGVEKKIPWVFASVARCGSGYIAFIAGEISSDAWIERFPANARWLVNLSELLVAETERNKTQASSPVQLPFSFLLSGRSVNKQLVSRVGEQLRNSGTQAWLDADHSVPGESPLQPARRGLDQISHYVLFWSRACLGAPWVERDLSWAVAMAIERQIPMIVVRLDLSPVPKILADFFRIEGLGMSPQELATASIHAARRLGRNRI